MKLRKFWRALRDYLSGRRLEQAKKRHEEAARRLDAAVKELLKK
ncbi:hypothetical protein [Roseitranquillus sediminis]|nr:hypothetical protein [Roseitranquillus sediminis]